MASKPLYYVIAILALLGTGVWAYTQYLDRHNTADLPLTPEAKLYTRNLQLSDVELKAKENYFQQAVVEIDGKIANTGPRPLETVEIYCVFRDPYGQLVLRRRLSIVNSGLKPGQTKSFRLPFDDLPQSWNQSMPQLVIAGVKFLMSKVLLVDDDKAGLDLRKLILEREGHQVSIATDPAQARSLFLSTPPDFIVLDLRLPEPSDGLSLILDFRSASPGVRIIALCGWPPDIEGTPESQMVDTVLAKPTRTATLISTLS